MSQHPFDSRYFEEEISEEYAIKHLNDETGLLQNPVRSIFIDDGGFLWILNYIALQRYDGKKIESFDEQQLRSRRTTTYEADLGYNIVFDQKTKTYGILHSWYARVMAEINNGQIHTPHLKWDHAHFIRAHTPTGNAHILGSKSHPKSRLLSKFDLDTDDLTYVINDNRAYIFDYDKHNGPTTLIYVHEDSASIVNAPIPSPLSTRTYKSSLLILDEKKGLFEISADSIVNIYPYPVIDSVRSQTKSGVLGKFVSQIHQDHPVIHLDGTLYQIKGGTGQLSFLPILRGVLIPDVNAVLISPDQHHIFIASASDGVFHLRKKTFKNTYDPHMSINQSSYSIMEYRNQILLSSGQRLNTDDYSIVNSLQKEYGSMAKNQKQEVYAYTKGGIQKVLQNDPDSRPDDLGIDCFSAELGTSPSGEIWFAQDSLIGTLFSQKEHLYKVKKENNYNCIAFLAKDQIWIGTNHGLYVIDTQEKKIHKKENTNQYHVRDIHPLSDSLFLLATYGQGLCYIEKGQLFNLPTDYLENNVYAHKIISDHIGTYWISTNTGLFRYDEKALKNYIDGKTSFLGYQYYDRSNGFATNEFNGGISPSGLYTSTGDIVFPSLKGIVHFNPQHISIDTFDYGINIDISIDGHRLSYLDTIIFKNQFQRITFSISSPNYNHANNLQLWYRLKNYDTEWQKVPENGEVTYTNASSGIRLFEVKRIGFTGSEKIKRVQFKVPKLWHETWFFRVLALIAIAIFVYGISLLRIVHLKRNRDRLKKQVKEQYTELVEQNQVLEEYVHKLQQSETSLFKQIHLKERLIGLISHDVLGTLKSVALMSKELNEKKTILKEERRAKYLRNMHQASSQLYTTMKQMLSWVKIQKEELTLTPENINIHALINDIQSALIIYTELYNSNITNQIQPSLSITSDRQVLRSILYNLLENEVKHGKSAYIFMRAVLRTNHVIITIDNTTHPIEQWKKINAYYASGDNTLINSFRMEHGLGLMLTKELVSKINATLKITDLNQAGHRIDLQLPLLP